MNPFLSLVLLVGGLRAGRAQGAGTGPNHVLRTPGASDAAVVAGLVGATALLALTAVVIGCCAVGLAVLLFL